MRAALERRQVSRRVVLSTGRGSRSVPAARVSETEPPGAVVPELLVLSRRGQPPLGGCPGLRGAGLGSDVLCCPSQGPHSARS